MKFSNDRIIRDMNIETFERFGKEGLLRKIDELEARIDALEAKPKLGRPRKIANG